MDVPKTCYPMVEQEHRGAVNWSPIIKADDAATSCYYAVAEQQGDWELCFMATLSCTHRDPPTLTLNLVNLKPQNGFVTFSTRGR